MIIQVTTVISRRTYPGVYLIPMLGIMASVAVIGIQIGYQVHCVQGLDWHPDRVLRVLHQLLSMEYSGFTWCGINASKDLIGRVLHQLHGVGLIHCVQGLDWHPDRVLQ